jgi:hypothetical protein
MTAKPGKTQRQKGVLPAWKLRFFEVGILVKVPEFDAYYIGTDWIYHTALDPDPVKTEWTISRKIILNAWISRHPGTRPYAWWCFDAPETRQRVGGTGTPKHEVLKYAPVHVFGIPRYWVTSKDTGILTRPGCKGKALDTSNPPLFESQAAYLERLDLMSDTEKSGLPGDAYDLEAVVCAKSALL